MGEIVDATRLGQRLGLSKGTVLGLAKSGTIPAIRLSGRSVRFDVDRVMASLNAEAEAEKKRAFAAKWK